MKILITAGPTQEAIDPVRFITNHSSGRMGYALAVAAIKRGWSVTLVSGPVSLTPPEGLAEFVPVVSAADMAQAVKSRFPETDALVSCAAVADYRPVTVAMQKIKKSDGNLTIELERTEDILKSLGQMKREKQILIGFAAETENLKENAIGKLQRKNLDWIAANNVSRTDCGFQSAQNEITLYHRSGKVVFLPLEDKSTLAEKMLQAIFGE